MTTSDTPTTVTSLVTAAKKPLPKWVGLLGLCIIAMGTANHDYLVTMFGGKAFGEWMAATIIVLGGVLSVLSHSLGGTGGKDSGTS